MSEKLTKTALSALRWNYLGFLMRSACSVIIGILLARLLGPKPFGQVAAASLVWGLANQVADAGFSSALVQAPELTQRQIRFAFTSQVLMGAAMMIAAIIAAPYLGLAFHDTAIQTVLRAMAPLFLLQSFAQTSTGLLKRNLTFQAVQKAQVSSYLFGYLVIGLPAAYLGAGVWSLVSAQLGQAFCYAVQVYASVRHSIVPCLDRAGVRLLCFGSKVTIANIVNWSISNLDNAFVGHAFGSTSLGLYSRAFTLASTPAEGIVGACQVVLFASCSRAGDQAARIRRAYLAVVAAIAMITLPLFWSMAVCVPAVVVGLYGAKWTEATPLFRPLALAMPLHALMALSGPILAATDHVEREVRTQALSLVFAVVAFAISARYSLAAVAWAVVVAYAFRYWAATVPTLRLLAIGWRDLARVLAGPITAAVVTVCVVFTVHGVAIYYRVQPLYLLAGLGLTGAGTLCALLALAGDRILPQELVSPLMHVSERLPIRLARALDILTARQVLRRERKARPFEPLPVSDLPGAYRNRAEV
jgi:O-antigen/teichoic acid export membrane protein